jgi:hypothetical protein
MMLGKSYGLLHPMETLLRKPLGFHLSGNDLPYKKGDFRSKHSQTVKLLEVAKKKFKAIFWTFCVQLFVEVQVDEPL